MVWQSTQSALYKAVDVHNSAFSDTEKSTGKSVGKGEEKSCKNSSENRTEKAPQKDVQKRGQKRAENPVRSCPKSRQNDPVSKILSDKDLLLIAGLIFILYKENADKKLILALVIVLLEGL